ncbi:MAG: PfkB family carbohydrate kinase [archaeon GW2011_AR3]|nr:MAG: PfkB family carbohydrate kinase [archaeon GW2011_AR3]MBS3108922.1 adenosine kinase [Candidatus Woesearchaeota archaeon]
MAEAKDSEGRDQKKYDVMGIGNALMDILVSLPEEKFLTFRIEKGTMSLVNEARVKEIEEKLLGHEQSLEPGGASANTLSCLALLGSKVIFVGTVGKDRHGDIYEKKLIETGVESRIGRKEGMTGKAITLITPDTQRTFAVHIGCASKIGHESILENDIRDSRILYITAYELVDELLRKTCLHAMELAKKHGTLIALDLADVNVIKGNLHDLVYVADKYVDVLLANEAEAEAFTGKKRENAAMEMSSHSKICAVKLGPEGSIIVQDGKMSMVEGRLANAVDTTGAGDMYAAGILYGIANGLGLEKAANLGSFLGAKVVEKVGARLTKEEISGVHNVFSVPEEKPEVDGDSIHSSEIVALGDGKFNVASKKEKGKYYMVDMNTKWCECPSFYYHKKECKHMQAVKDYMLRQE